MEENLMKDQIILLKFPPLTLKKSQATWCSTSVLSARTTETSFALYFGIVWICSEGLLVHSEGYGWGVNCRLEPFRKFIRFGSVTRPLNQHWIWIETQKWILTMSQGLPTDNGHRFCEEALSTTECSVSVKQWCVRITRTFFIKKYFLSSPWFPLHIKANLRWTKEKCFKSLNRLLARRHMFYYLEQGTSSLPFLYFAKLLW